MGPPQDEQQQEEEEEEERGPVIATTPLRRDRSEDSPSRSSSSETPNSASTGTSLGEAIRRKTAAPWGVEPWFHLPAEVDSSCLTAASETRLGLAWERNDLSEFPTLEEGLLSSAEASGRCYPGVPARESLLELQDSRFSPCLPLVPCWDRSRSFPEESLPLPSGTDLEPLRGIPDVSGGSQELSEHSQFPGAPSLSDTAPPLGAPGGTLSQPPHPGAATSQNSLSGQLGSKEATKTWKNDEEESISQTNQDLGNCSPKEIPMGAAPPEQAWRTSGKGGHSSRDQDVPAAGLELSGKEKEFLRQEESSSSGSSSCKTALIKMLEKNERETEKEKGRIVGSEGEVLEELEKEQKVPELDLSNHLSDGWRNEFKNPDAPDVPSAKTSEPGMSKERGVELNDSGSSRFVAVPEELQGALPDHQQKQPPPAAGFGKGELVPAVTTTRDCAPGQPVVGMESAPCNEESPVGAEPGGSGNELTASDFSIERGHKVTDISPSFNLAGDASFSLPFAHPNYQSTPGIFLKRNGKAEGLGVLGIQSDHPTSPSCSKEGISGNSPVSLGKQHPPHCAPKGNNDHSEPFRWKYPHTGRIQSLPSLSFMEKVGSWNMSQPEQVPPAVTPRGFSPGRKASSAIACSSSHAVSIPKSSRDPKGFAASSRGAGSLGSLHFPTPNSLLVPPLRRSQSDHAVNVSSRATSLAGILPPANSMEALQPPEGKSHVSGAFGNNLGGSMIQKVVPGSSSEDTESDNTGQSSDPNVLASSVAQFLPKDGISANADHRNWDAPENQPLNLSIPAGPTILDNFGTISLDSLTLPVSPGRSSRRSLGSPRSSGSISRHFPTAGGDNSIPVQGTSWETPKKEELDIEERIPS
ncbi:uncharacterized protein [Pithys albifrons albifrons]|uniref:uncharacterized protein n=1 Tax=Pithys albifrons albifrons TaxID=3385563 RepID=UPI003A5CDDD2